MILDSSTILSPLLKEPGLEHRLERHLAADYLGASTATLLETGMVLVHRLAPQAAGMPERFLALTGMTEISLGPEHWHEVLECHIAYGKGRSPAGLNFGSCISYATAWVADKKLVYVGDDFPFTDKQ